MMVYHFALIQKHERGVGFHTTHMHMPGFGKFLLLFAYVLK